MWRIKCEGLWRQEPMASVMPDYDRVPDASRDERRKGVTTVLKGKAAIVTGGDSGIGHAIAVALAAQGAAVTVNYHRNQDAAATLKAIEDGGGIARTQQGDVSKIDDIAALIDETVAAYGRLDVMVNNAGMETRSSVLETTAEQFDLVVAIDLRHETREWSRHSDLNRGPAVYETAALPLSYVGPDGEFTNAGGAAISGRAGWRASQSLMIRSSCGSTGSRISSR
jgi:NAD(P)-dependent dehydrogenase (short-subunit alcohol dehydrogenase family)